MRESDGSYGALVLAVTFVAASATAGCGDGETGEAADATGGPPTALVGATIIDGTGGTPIADGVLVIAADTIACVGTGADCPLPEGAEVHDATGRYLTPGLIDAHVHFSQTGWLDGRPDGVDLRERYPYEPLVEELRADPDRFFAAYLCAGVTGAFDVGGYRWTVQMARARAGDPAAPHLRAAGPLISHAGREILSTADDSQFIMLTSEEAGVAGVRELAALGADAIKVWYLEPPDEEWDEIEARFRAVAAAAREAGLPLIVHATELRTARVAVDAGAFMLVHSVTDREVDDEFVALIRERGTIYAPTLVVSRNWARAVEAASTGTVPKWEDPVGCVDARTAERIREAPSLPPLVDGDRFTTERFEAARARLERQDAVMAANVARLHAAGVPVVVATDAGNPLTLHGASIHQELDAMEAAGIPPADLLVMATRNGARAMRRPDLGTLEAGKVADLLVLAADPLESASAFRRLEGVFHLGLQVER